MPQSYAIPVFDLPRLRKCWEVRGTSRVIASLFKSGPGGRRRAHKGFGGCQGFSGKGEVMEIAAPASSSVMKKNQPDASLLVKIKFS